MGLILDPVQLYTLETVPALATVSVPVPVGNTILVPVHTQLPGTKTNKCESTMLLVIESVYLVPAQLKVPVTLTSFLQLQQGYCKSFCIIYIHEFDVTVQAMTDPLRRI
jgi:hypothetical protein